MTDLFPFAPTSLWAPRELQISGPMPLHRGAEINKLNDDWIPEHLSGNTAIQESWDMLTRRLRDQHINDPVFIKADAQLTSLVIGEGLQAFASAMDAEGNEIDDYNDESDTWFCRWAEEEVDAAGEHSLWEMQRLSFSDTTKVGGSLWLRTINPDPSRICPLGYRLIEWEQLARDYDTNTTIPLEGVPKGHQILNGIEYDANGIKVAFWIHFDHPYDQNTLSTLSRPTRVPAERVIHNYFPSQISDTTGVSWYTALMLTAKDRDRVIGRTLTALGVSALLTLVVKEATRNSCTGLTDLDPDTGRSVVKMGYPFIARIGKNDSVEVAESKKGVFELKSLLEHIQVLEAQGCRISVNRVAGDPSKANMASLRASHEDDEGILAPVRQHQGRRLAARVRKEWTRFAIATGRLKTVSADAYKKSQWRYESFDIVGSHRGDVSPQERIESSIDSMRSGLSTFKREAAKMGLNWRKVIRDMKQVNEYAKRYSVVLDWTKGQGAAPDSATSIAGDAKTEEAAAP